MFDLNKLIVEAYEEEKSKDFSFDRLVEMVEAVMVMQESLGVINEDAPMLRTGTTPKEITITYNKLPQINLSELGWANPAAEAQDIDSAARTRLETLLEGYINKTDSYPASLKDTISRLAAAFPKDFDEQYLDKAISADGTNVDRNLNLLIAYKTLTEIVRNFGASPAGFIFESFISTLLGGSQVPTGQQTIADLTTAKGEPLSLKLLNARGYIKGSFTDLINDLSRSDDPKYNTINYLVCIKRTTGRGMNINGAIDFNNYTITANNLIKLFMIGGTEKAKNYIRLPTDADGKIIIPDKLKPATQPAQPIQEAEKITAAPEMTQKFSLWAENNLDQYKKAFETDYAIPIPTDWFKAFGVSAPTDLQAKYFEKLKQKRISQPPVKDPATLFDYFVEGSDFLDKQQLGSTAERYFKAYSNLVMRDILADQITDPVLKKIVLDNFDHRLKSYTPENIKEYVTKYNLSKQGLGDLFEKLPQGEQPNDKVQIILKRYGLEDYGLDKKIKTTRAQFERDIKALDLLPIQTKGKYEGPLKSISGYSINRFNEKARNPMRVAFNKAIGSPEEITLDRYGWSTPQAAAQYLQGKTKEELLKALRVSYGMVNSKNWAFSKKQLDDAHAASAPQVVSEGLLTEADSQKTYLGSIYVGVNNVMKLADAVAMTTDKQIFELFDQLNKLTTSLEAFYASNLQDSNAGVAAADSAGEIEDSFEGGKLKQNS